MVLCWSYLLTNWRIVWGMQAAKEQPLASDKPFQGFGFTSDDKYTQGTVCLLVTKTFYF